LTAYIYHACIILCLFHGRFPRHFCDTASSRFESLRTTKRFSIVVVYSSCTTFKSRFSRYLNCLESFTRAESTPEMADFDLMQEKFNKTRFVYLKYSCFIFIFTLQFLNEHVRRQKSPKLPNTDPYFDGLTPSNHPYPKLDHDTNPSSQGQRKLPWTKVTTYDFSSVHCWSTKIN
jgi:hypothetical protein